MNHSMRLILSLFCGLVWWAADSHAQSSHTPTPTAAQLAWHNTEFYLFFHFGPNTFTNLEWGHGTETEDLFNPSALDCNQWCRIAKQAGAKGVIITAKHHDGFCLWPSQYSKHTVRESKWREGRGDVLRELSNAAKKHGLKLGFYLSPWDRNHPKYGTPEYNEVYAHTLTELLTNYGDLFEIWWDGANGEGPNGKKQVYDFHRFEKIAAQLQPNAVIFSDIGPGCRWAGNELGLILTETNWCTLDTAGFQRGDGGPPLDSLNQGNMNGAHWIPAECDVSIRPGWFYHAEEDQKVKSPDQLFQIYLQSVGRNANLILNVPPDPRGLIHEQDSAALVGLGKRIKQAFDENLLLGKPQLSAKRAKTKRSLSRATDGDKNTCETLLNTGKGKSSFVFDLQQEAIFNTLVLREYIQNGQQVQAFQVEAKQKESWEVIAQSSTIGARKILTFPPIKARYIRVVFSAYKVIPKISEIELYHVDKP